MRRGPPGCLSGVRCPAPSAGSWPPHRRCCLPLACNHLRPRSCLSQPACSDASWGSRRSSRAGATPDSWLTVERPLRLWPPHPAKTTALTSRILLQHGPAQLGSLRHHNQSQLPTGEGTYPPCLCFLPPIGISLSSGGLATPGEGGEGGGGAKNNSDSQRRLHLLLIPSRGES